MHKSTLSYEKSRSGNIAGATHVQIYKITHNQLDTIFTQSDAKLLLYVLKSFAGSYQLKQTFNYKTTKPQKKIFTLLMSSLNITSQVQT
jgi:hypothetical protein